MATVSGHAALVRFSMILVGLAVLAVAGDELDRVIPQLEQWIADRGALAPVGFIVLTLVCVPLLAPDTLFGVMAGVLFGVGPGTLCFFVGSYLGCVVSYELARGLLRKRVADRVRRRPKLAAVRAAARREGLRITALLRLTPLSAALVSYLLGAAKVSRPRFLVGTLALLPAHFVTVYFGVVAKHVTKMAAQGHAAWDLQGALLVVGLVVAVGVIAFVGRLVHRAVVSAPGAP